MASPAPRPAPAQSSIPSRENRGGWTGVLLAFGVFGGGTAWVLHLGLSYASVPWVCAEGATWVLHLLTTVTVLLSAAATGASIAVWRRPPSTGGARPADEGEAGVPAADVTALARTSDRTTRFLALAGMILSGFFLVLILAEGMPLLLLENPCAYVPTLDGPIV